MCSFLIVDAETVETPELRGVEVGTGGPGRAVSLRGAAAPADACVAEPGFARAGRALSIARFLILVQTVLEDAGMAPGFFLTGPSRLRGVEDARNPDVCFFLNPRHAIHAAVVEGDLDARRGDPMPDLVVEIDRPARTTDALAPYFRMGVREAWTCNQDSGARIWVPDTRAGLGVRSTDRSRALPNLRPWDIDDLLAARTPTEISGNARRLARRVGRAILAQQQGQ